MEPDRVDEIVAQWHRERPEIDVSAMGILGRLTRLEKLVSLQLNSVFSRHGLETWEFDVLATLVRTGEPHQLTPGQLLDEMMITSGAMTNRIDRLEKRGFVKRIKNPADGRQILVTLTKQGQTKADEALVDHAANETSLVAGLDRSEQDQLINLFRTLHRSVVDESRPIED